MKIQNFIGLTVSTSILFTSVVSGFVSYGYDAEKFSELPNHISELYDFSKVDSISNMESDDVSSLTLKNTDGTYTMLQFDEPIKYYDSKSDSFKYIDNSIVKSDEKDYAFENKANSFSCKFSDSCLDGIIFEDDSYSIKFVPSSSEPSFAKLESQKDNNETVIYKDAFGKNIDLQYITTNNGLKENVIIDSCSDFSSYSFNMELSGLIISEYKGEQISLVDPKTDKQVFTFAPAFIVDSTGENISYDNYYTVEKKSESNYKITMNLDEEFLCDKNTQYPCIVDPVIYYTGTNNFSGSYAAQSGTTFVNNYYKFGNFNGMGECISYIKVTGLNKKKWLNPDNILQANLKLRDCSSGNYNSGTITCYDSTSKMDVSNVTYSQLVSAIGMQVSSTQISSANDEYSFDITYLMKKWIMNQIGQGGFSYDYGFILRGNSNLVNRTAFKIDPANVYSQYIEINFNYDVIEDGIYKISSAYNQNYICNNGLSQNATALSTTLSNSGKWMIKRGSSGKYTIQPYNDSSLYLRVSSSAVNTNATVSASGYDWNIVRNSDGTFRIMPGTTENVATALSYSIGEVKLDDYSNINTKKWNIKFLYEATVNNYYDKGYFVRYGEPENVSKSKINGYINNVGNRYMELFGLNITINNAEYYNSIIDQCKGNVTISNIDALCTDVTNHTERSNLIWDFNGNISGSNLLTNALWTGHRITTDNLDNNRSCSAEYGIFMLSLYDSSNRTYNSESVLMHELNHQYGVPDHYHEIVNGECKNKSICSECGVTKRPKNCIMNLGRTDINRDDVMCEYCKDDMVNHLDNHHKT